MEDAEPLEGFKVAFLGPEGAYSHQSAVSKFGDTAIYVAQPTISAVFDAVSSGTPCAVVPQQNSTFGSVIETYDNLRRLAVGSTVFIRGETTMSIQHCLVVRPGVKQEEITRIVSHEQALGQCAEYLKRQFPTVVLQKVSSTAKAAKLLLESDDANQDTESDSEGETAAICSSHCAQLFGLEVLEENIQDRSDNCTRFFVIASSLEVVPPYVPHAELFRALIRLGVARIEDIDSEFEGFIARRPLQLVVSTLLTTFGVPITRIDRRPSVGGAPFEDVYFVELEELGSPPDPANPGSRTADYTRWFNKVQKVVERARASDVEATVLGVW